MTCRSSSRGEGGPCLSAPWLRPWGRLQPWVRLPGTPLGARCRRGPFSIPVSLPHLPGHGPRWLATCWVCTMVLRVLGGRRAPAPPVPVLTNPCEVPREHPAGRTSPAAGGVPCALPSQGTALRWHGTPRAVGSGSPALLPPGRGSQPVSVLSSGGWTDRERDGQTDRGSRAGGSKMGVGVLHRLRMRRRERRKRPCFRRPGVPGLPWVPVVPGELQGPPGLPGDVAGPAGAGGDSQRDGCAEGPPWVPMAPGSTPDAGCSFPLAAVSLGGHGRGGWCTHLLGDPACCPPPRAAAPAPDRQEQQWELGPLLR